MIPTDIEFKRVRQVARAPQIVQGREALADP
jgi:hypothetical protein